MASSARIQLAVLFVLLVAIAALVEKSAAATYVVGDTMGWTIPSGGASSYASWAARHTFRPGDVLVFNFPTGAHDVGKVDKASFDSCSSTNPTTLITVGPANITLSGAGTEYFICTFGQHCSLGQKLAITVSASSPPAPAPTKPPTPTPTPPTATPTPPTSAPTVPPSPTSIPPASSAPTAPPTTGPTPTSSPTPTPSPSTTPSSPTTSPTGGPTLGPSGASSPAGPGSGAPDASSGSPGATPGAPESPPSPPSPSSSVLSSFSSIFVVMVSVGVGILC
ncbi:hypothetical protein M9H77_02085 [Catharanthus roseus]|uniref:Uncharacterized protein n=1 Tax=Catharanthus roseus TaxID=4058 RepID=A0ACC0C7C0_CATRO|nr:hypothetical protein M9H77_02085 [Catharanthus roseus]